MLVAGQDRQKYELCGPFRRAVYGRSEAHFRFPFFPFIYLSFFCPSQGTHHTRPGQYKYTANFPSLSAACPKHTPAITTFLMLPGEPSTKTTLPPDSDQISGCRHAESVGVAIPRYGAEVRHGHPGLWVSARRVASGRRCWVLRRASRDERREAVGEGTPAVCCPGIDTLLCTGSCDGITATVLTAKGDGFCQKLVIGADEKSLDGIRYGARRKCSAERVGRWTTL
ncbi:hypothetical protein LZ30DRAFT_724302 [Colletotrichum cereale]|nr:hypothetical protein LZ30DRAFT_724302 [Colletotrichum cereale]